MDGLKGRPLTFRAWDHQLLQPMYVVAAKDKSKWKDKWDIFEIIGEVPGREPVPAGADVVSAAR
jgi:branched-chain amino acid transport system substrate-binding protein